MREKYRSGIEVSNTQMQPVLAETLLLLLLQIGLAVAAREPWTPTFTIPKDPNCLSDGYTTYICVKEPPPCPGLRQHFDLRKEEYKGERKFLIYGHNGLRNRLAQKLNVCDMLHITWDNKLAELANRHHRHCERATYETEKHMINIPGSEEELLRRTYQGGAGVFGRNAFFCPNIYVNNFIEFAVGKWYSLHQKLKPPIPVILREKEYLKIAGDNAFTHMIYPQTFRAGCSYAQ